MKGLCWKSGKDCEGKSLICELKQTQQAEFNQNCPDWLSKRDYFNALKCRRITEPTQSY